MRHWYRYECHEADRKDELCKWLRRQKFQYESGGPVPRRIFKAPKHNSLSGGDFCQAPVYYVQAFLDEAELAKADAWLQTH